MLVGEEVLRDSPDGGVRHVPHRLPPPGLPLQPLAIRRTLLLDDLGLPRRRPPRLPVLHLPGLSARGACSSRRVF